MAAVWALMIQLTAIRRIEIRPVKLAVFHDGNMADPVLGHDLHALRNGILRVRDRLDVDGHDFGDGGLLGAASRAGSPCVRSHVPEIMPTRRSPSRTGSAPTLPSAIMEMASKTVLVGVDRPDGRALSIQNGPDGRCDFHQYLLWFLGITSELSVLAARHSSKTLASRCGGVARRRACRRRDCRRYAFS